MVQEVAVLFRVQRFQQGGCRVTLEGGADLVDLIQHDHRVRNLGILQRLNKLARHGADVGATVAFDFGFITHAAHAEAVEFPAQCVRHGMAYGRLANARWAYQQED